MKILGIHDGHNSGASLLIDGKIAAAICEERLTRNKNELGYPKRSIEEVLDIVGLDPLELDSVVYASNFMHTADHLSKAGEWYRAGLDDQVRDAQRDKGYLKAVYDKRKQERVLQVVEQLGIHKTKVGFVEHHLAHGAAAYYAAPFDLDEPILILTCDGAGDGLSSTVSIGRGTKIERIAETSRAASLGKVYSRVTYALGLTPWEHEYKVMGLAPYADQKYGEEVRDILQEHLTLSDDGLTFALVGELQSSYIYEFLRDRLERKRFDAVSAGVQMLTEDLLQRWVRAVINHTGIRKIVCGGGVFMNVKANQAIAKLSEVESMFVFPSCGDESLSFGAAWVEYVRLAGDAAITKKTPLKDLYLGREFSNEIISKVLDSKITDKACTIEKRTEIEEDVALLLSKNKVVARFSGRMEWGARALGNRSILTNPNEWPNVEKINAMIKMRDFWMPFAPSILAEETDRYIDNPKRLNSPFMMHAFDTLQKTAGQISAATHPRDKTARAQFVHRDVNPSYWSLIKSFEQKTGCAAVLNTSFNLHGFPLVNTPEDAIFVFLNSGLDYLAIGDYLVTKAGATINV